MNRNRTYPESIAVARLRVLANERRIQVVKALKGKELSVSEVANLTKTQQPTASENLKDLYKAGFLERSKSGIQVYYKLADNVATDIISLLEEEI